MDYQKYLAELISYQETGKGKHEWIMNSKADAVKLANYLRGHAYTVKYTHSPSLKYIGCDHLITVPAHTLL